MKETSRFVLNNNDHIELDKSLMQNKILVKTTNFLLKRGYKNKANVNLFCFVESANNTFYIQKKHEVLRNTP